MQGQCCGLQTCKQAQHIWKTAEKRLRTKEQGEKNIDIQYKIWYLFNKAKYYGEEYVRRHDGLCTGTW